MKRLVTRTIPLLLVLMLFAAFMTSVAYAAEPCEHEWGEPVVTKEATCREAGEMTYTCTKCGETKTEAIAKIAHTPKMVIKKKATVKTSGIAITQCSVCDYFITYPEQSYYEAYTLTYRSLNGAETLLGTFRIINGPRDYFYGSEGVVETFPDIPNPDAAPTGYRISTFSANKYAVLENGVPDSSFVPGNRAVSMWPWMNDTDTAYTVVSLFVIADPQVTVAQDGATLTAAIANRSESLAYTYQWYKNGTAIEGATESTCKVTEACADASAKYSVAVTVKNAADSKIPLCNPTQVVTVKSAELDTTCPHTWDAGKVTKEATCREAGEMTYTCTTCQETKVEVIGKKDHTPVMEVIKEATAKSRGQAYKKCSVCGAYARVSGGVTYWTGAKTKFNFYKPYTLIYRSLSGTETTVGSFRGVSITNDYYGSEGLPKKFPAMPNPDKAPVGYEISTYDACKYMVLVNGKPEDSFTPGNDAQSVSYAWLNDTDTSYTVVSVFVISQPQVTVTQDGGTLTAAIANRSESLAYTYQWYKNGTAIEGATESTCKVTEACTDASAEYSVEVTVKSAADSKVPTVNPNQVETGTSAPVKAEAVHKPVEDPAVAATCTEPGKTAGSHCEVCGEVLVKQEVVPATGHKAVVDIAVSATCEKVGLTEGSHCSVCGTVLAAQTEIPALSHKYGAWEDAKDGKTHTRVCANDPAHIERENHSYGKWTVTKAATETEAGSKVHECGVCGYKETAVIPKLDATTPATGDEAPIAAFFLLAVLSLTGVACMAAYTKKRA